MLTFRTEVWTCHSVRWRLFLCTCNQSDDAKATASETGVIMHEGSHFVQFDLQPIMLKTLLPMKNTVFWDVT
jgi:hypothetical protein